MTLMQRVKRPFRGRKKLISLILGVIFAVLSVASVISLYDFSGDSEAVGMVQIFLPLVFGAASSLSFLVGGYFASALFAGLGSVVFYMGLMFFITLIWGP